MHLRTRGDYAASGMGHGMAGRWARHLNIARMAGRLGAAVDMDGERPESGRMAGRAGMRAEEASGNDMGARCDGHDGAAVPGQRAGQWPRTLMADADGLVS